MGEFWILDFGFFPFRSSFFVLLRTGYALRSSFCCARVTPYVLRSSETPQVVKNRRALMLGIKK